MGKIINKIRDSLNKPIYEYNLLELEQQRKKKRFFMLLMIFTSLIIIFSIIILMFTTIDTVDAIDWEHDAKPIYFAVLGAIGFTVLAAYLTYIYVIILLLDFSRDIDIIDIVTYLTPKNIDSKFPKLEKSYAELTIRRRQEGASRLDLRLADWFRGIPLPPGEDNIWEQIKNKESKTIRFINWDSEKDFQEKLLKVLVKELNLKDKNDVAGFNISLGSLNILIIHSLCQFRS